MSKMIAIAILLCVTTVASKPLGATGPFDFYGPQSQQTGRGGWGYFTSHNPVSNVGYTAMYNTVGKESPGTFGRLPVSLADFTGLPYGMSGYPRNGYFPGSPSTAYDPYGFQDLSSLSSENYGFQGNFETRSDNNQRVQEDVLKTSESGTAGLPKPTKPFVNTVVTFNRLKIMRLAMQNAMMFMLG